MKRKLVLCMGAMLWAGILTAQTLIPEWQVAIDKVKKTDEDKSHSSFRRSKRIVEREK